MAKHGQPPPDHTCQCTWADITTEEGNYVEFRAAPSGTWHPCGYSSDIVRQLLQTQFNMYMENVKKASKDCAAAVRRLVNKGPPVYLEDRIALPLPDGDTHVDMLWFADDGKEVSAKLEGALEGGAREELWNAQKEILAAMEAAEQTN